MNVRNRQGRELAAMAVTFKGRRAATAGFSRLLAGGTALGFGLLAMTSAYGADQTTTLQIGPATIEDSALSEKNALNHAPAISTMPTTSLQDTPQAVTVVTAETIKEQATSTLGEALRNVPGITIAIGEGGTLAGDQFKIRGFDAKDDVYLDGLRDFAAYTRDSFAYEEVQVLKGPSGLMFGRGTTGGAINTVSKTPTLNTSFSAHFEGGNGAHARTTEDANYKIDDTSAVRVAFMYTNTGVVDRDMTFSHRWGIAPSLALGLGTDTTFTLSYIHQHSNNRQDYGLPVANPTTSIFALPAPEFGIARNTFIGYKTDRDNNDADLVTAKVSHVVSDWLVLENDARVAVYSRYFQYSSVDRCDTTVGTNFCSYVVTGTQPGVSQTAALAGMGGGGPYQQDSWGWQDTFSANANFHLGGFKNQLIAGGDISYQKADRTVYAYTLPTTAQFTYLLGDHTATRANIGRPFFDNDHNPPPGYNVVLPTLANVAGTNATATTVVNSTGKANDYAFFATDRFWFTDALSLIAGVRVDRYIANYSSTTVAGVFTPAHSPSTLANPRGSLVYEPDQNTTIYASYGKSATPQGTSVVGSPTPITTTNQSLDPERSETFEIGAKENLFDGKLGLTGSIFQVKKSNATLVDPSSGTVTLQSGQQQRVRGFEASATGNLTSDFSIIAAYTYLDPIVTADLSCSTTAPIVCKPNPFTVGKMITFVPRHAASLWSDYKLTALAKGLSVGGGLVYQSKLHNGYTLTGAAPNPTGIARYVLIPETVELDAVAAYEIDRYRFAVNLNNITDRLNYSQSFGNRATPAPGRTVIASVDVKF